MSLPCCKDKKYKIYLNKLESWNEKKSIQKSLESIMDWTPEQSVQIIERAEKRDKVLIFEGHQDEMLEISNQLVIRNIPFQTELNNGK